MYKITEELFKEFMKIAFIRGCNQKDFSEAAEAADELFRKYLDADDEPEEQA